LFSNTKVVGWLTFLTNEVLGDVLLVELRIIHIEIGLEFYRYKGYNNIVCENASNRNY
jgi:hypothetical protein